VEVVVVDALVKVVVVIVVNVLFEVVVGVATFDLVDRFVTVEIIEVVERMEEVEDEGFEVKLDDTARSLILIVELDWTKSLS
jgi:hypothetical protein